MTAQDSELPPARIGFVGAGSHATQSLYPNIPLIPEFELVAVCDLIEEKARLIGNHYGAPHLFTDVEGMLEALELDGVCICGSHEMHHDVALQVLGRGIPIFTEKPPANTLAQAQEMATQARDNGVWGMVAFMKRFAPGHLLVKELMAQPQFGEFTSLSAIHGCGPHPDTRYLLLRNGIHIIDLSRFFGGDIRELHAYGFDAEKLKAVVVNLSFANGAVGQLNINCAQTWPDCFEHTYITGREVGVVVDTGGSVEVKWPAGRFAEGRDLELFAWSNRYSVSHTQSGWAPGGHYTRGYWGELSHFARACQGAVEPLATLDDGVEAMRVIEAIMCSLASGQPLSLADVG